MAGAARGTLAASLILVLSGCGPRPYLQLPQPQRRIVALNRANLGLRVSPAPNRSARTPLIIYATGDGGWRGLDRDIFDRFVSWGYPVAGIDSGAYIGTLGDTGETTPERLAHDFRRIIGVARESLRLPPDTPIVLVGLSRGSGLAVVASREAGLQPDVAGVLALALTKEEEHVKHSRKRRANRLSDPGEAAIVDTYAVLHRLRTRIAVIQSTHDRYLSAADARQRFGPDTATRRLIAVDAKSHSFGAAHDALFARMKTSLSWICGALRPPFKEPAPLEPAEATLHRQQ